MSEAETRHERRAREQREWDEAVAALKAAILNSPEVRSLHRLAVTIWKALRV